MTVNAEQIVTHADGVQSRGFVAFLGHRISAGAGKTLYFIISLLLTLLWIESLVVTWIGKESYGPPLFQTTIAAIVIIAVAHHGKRTVSWIAPLIASALWVTVSVVPFIPIWQCVFQAVTVTLLAFGACFAWAAADESERV